MATANIKTFCSSCEKDNGRVRCEGCSKLFCLNDFNVHRQDLGTQLDEIEVNRDLFRQTLTEKISEPRNHVLIQQIDAWENESINKIRQAAEETRQILIEQTARLNTKLEEKLNMLTYELRQSRQENDFFEPNLNQWREVLNQIKNDLAKSSNITIRNDSTPFITKIIVDILDRSSQFNDSDNNNTSIQCRWCNQAIPLHIIGQHMRACRREEYQQLQTKLESFYENTVSDVTFTDSTAASQKVLCRFCGSSISPSGHKYHETHCTKNIRRTKNY